MNKTFLTTAWMNVNAAKNADGSNDQIAPTSEEAAAKRLIRNVGIAAVGTVTALVALKVILNKVEKNMSETAPEED